MHMLRGHKDTYFNPRSLAGATITLQYCQHFFEFQSTLPRGSDHSSVHCDKLTLISIHAPSRERPYFWMFVSMLLCISIHAPSRERPHHPQFGKICRHHFNPRSLAGATFNKNFSSYSAFISIHAPSRERRINRLDSISTIRFQSTLPRGSDRYTIRT